MKFITTQLFAMSVQPEMRRNLRTLFRYLLLLAGIICLYSVLFHALMAWEGQQHSWLTGMYWTLTVMSTLGFGDITFNTDLGRAFSIIVLISGIVMLLIVLPFTFIRFFYAPWLEAQVQHRAPRRVAPDLENHVIICHYDQIAKGLINRLEESSIPYAVLEPDILTAANLHADGVSAVYGEPTASETYEAVRAKAARLVFANLSDPANTNITLTVREVAPDVPIVARADDELSIDVIELSGATQVLPLRRMLGEHLASRVAVGTAHAHRIGRFEDLTIAELPIERTPLPGRTVRDTRLRELTGLSIVGVWEQGRFLPAGPETLLNEHSVPVIVGTEQQIADLDAYFAIYQPNENPVLVIGGGKVGIAAARTLSMRDVPVTVLERDASLESGLREVADRVIIGEAADLEAVMSAGLADAPSVVLTTNDDAINIFLAVYCRRLAPEVRIISRVTHEWNLEAIHRAGADFALSHASLAARAVLAATLGSELMILGEGADVFVDRLPPVLAGKSLGESGIGAKTGLHVIALRREGGSITNPRAQEILEAGYELVMLGTIEQHRAFSKVFS